MNSLGLTDPGKSEKMVYFNLNSKLQNALFLTNTHNASKKPLLKLRWPNFRANLITQNFVLLIENHYVFLYEVFKRC